LGRPSAGAALGGSLKPPWSPRTVMQHHPGPCVACPAAGMPRWWGYRRTAPGVPAARVSRRAVCRQSLNRLLACLPPTVDHRFGDHLAGDPIHLGSRPIAVEHSDRPPRQLHRDRQDRPRTRPGRCLNQKLAALTLAATGMTCAEHRAEAPRFWSIWRSPGPSHVRITILRGSGAARPSGALGAIAPCRAGRGPAGTSVRAAVAGG
jgi:hypothetical protein